MSWLRREFQVAPQAGVAVAALVAALAFTAFYFVALGFPVAVRIPLSGLMGLFIFVYGFLVAYVYGDARRRGMRYVLWAVVAAIVPNALGFIAYFLLREPLLRPCPACGAPARRGFGYCPVCGGALSQLCPACRRPVEPAWTHCAHCGAATASPSPAVPSSAEA